MPPEIIRYSPQPENNKELEPDLKTAIIYAGQGQGLEKLRSQSIQLRQNPAALQIYNQADEFLNDAYPHKFNGRFSSIIEESPEDDLRRNYQQLVVTLYNLACTKVLEQQKEFPEVSNIVAISGQSLGLISAIHKSGAIDVPNTLRLVVERQEAMRDARGTLVAFVAGGSDERLDKLKKDHQLETSIVTSTSLIVLGGEADAVNAAIEEAKSQKIQAIPLGTEGAFHTKLMKPAAKRFQQSLKGIEIRDAQIDVFANTTGKSIRTSRQLRRELVNQIPNPVLWLASTDSMTNCADQFIEIGNEGLLTNHIRRDLEKRTGKKGDIVKRLLMAGEVAAVAIGAAFTIRQALKDNQT